MKSVVRLLPALVFAAFVPAASAADLLIYKVSLTRNWQQFAAAREALPTSSPTAMRGKNPVGGVTVDKSYWILDRDAEKLIEIEYYTLVVDGQKQKLYDITYWTYQNLGVTPEDYTTDASGDDDQFMEVSSIATSRAGVNTLFFRSAVEDSTTPGESFAMSWHLRGKSSPVLGLSPTVSPTNVAATLTGDFLSLETRNADDANGPIYFVTTHTSGKHTATLDRALTLKARTVALPSLTADTLDNAIQHVAEVLEKSGHDLGRINR